MRPPWDIFLVGLGRLLGAAEICLRRLREKPSAPVEDVDHLDKTGRVVSAAERLPALWSEGDFLFPGYDSLAHSFWRAQELSLFRRVSDRLPRPLLDVGCGDGSFASLIFDYVDLGLDKDPAALETAAAYELYGRLLRGTDEAIPLPDGAAGAAFCNSVFEHVVDLPPLLRELSRALRPGGLLAFTVPVKGLERHLTRYFGETFSRELNAEYFHRNLWEPEEWTRRLAEAGFTVEESLSYQPPLFTFAYILLRFAGSRRGLGRWIPGLRTALWKVLKGRLVSMLKGSLAGVPDGANLFILARRAPAARPS